ncbi:hypothetical protein POSPLADRAFT_1047163 [Postia placenta MAD-698-R-SB12]|uniref:DUF6533 domain-containing protein n=1 Tax=Postia placenta MAD-698-R-SB12 TaxID=670580 RepID=A0A1X6MWR3_9APHY|nr:hypothetical protein POSPLADRAFT_1047163 [Postia placenta MAD-698-R-SB12]OSX60798.1 hypothetical protein POSPLADRAFT_1047163 [Postia placenta MAD-698-R-SB12]
MSLKDSGSWPFEAIKYFSGMFRQLNAAYVVENNSGVAVTLSLFDHVLTFRKELDLVWLQRGPWSIMQLVVVMNRYGGEASMLYLAYIVLLLRVYALWDNRRSVKYALYIGFMLLYDVFVFVTLVANALSRPRRNNSEIVTNLSRDRIFTFLVNYTFLTIGVCWTLDYILCFRLFLKMKDAEIRSGWEAMGTPGTVHIRETIEMMSI